MIEIEHALANQIIARDRALAHTHDDRGAKVRDKIASLIAADELALSERNKRFEDLIKYMTAAHDAENAAALVQREAAVAALLDEVDFHTRTSDTVVKGEPVMPIAATINIAFDPGPIEPGAVVFMPDTELLTDIETPPEPHAKPKIVRAA